MRKRRTPKRLTVEEIDRLIEERRSFVEATGRVGLNFAADAQDEVSGGHAQDCLAFAMGHAAVLRFLLDLRYEMLYEDEE